MIWTSIPGPVIIYHTGQAIHSYGDNKRGEKGIPMLPELSPN